jgi:hypothetical protein
MEALRQTALAQLKLPADYRLIVMATEIDYIPDLDAALAEYDFEGLADIDDIKTTLAEQTDCIPLPAGQMLVGLAPPDQLRPSVWGIITLETALEATP